MYKVVVIEDEEIIRKGIIFSVAWSEYDCVIVGEAENGIQGEKLIREQQPDIVIADINMPVKDGLEMLRDTHEEFEYSTIILSGYSSFEYAQKAIKYGVLEYLLKPLNSADLINAIKSAKDERKRRLFYLQQDMSKDEWAKLTVLKEKQEGINEIAKAMIDYVYQNYQKKIVMMDLVVQLNYSETYLNKKFKESMEMTFNEFLNRYRVQKAIFLLNEGKNTVQDIAWMSGIGEYKYFNVVFRKYVGCSPKSYLKKVNP